MKKIIFVLMIILFSCSNMTQYDVERTGKAVVVEKIYTPESSGSGVAVGTGVNMTNGSFSTSSSGSFGSLSSVSVHTNRSFDLVFQSDWDGVFVIDDRELYGKYKIGDTVEFSYTVIMNRFTARRDGERVVLGEEEDRVRHFRFINDKEYYAEY